MGWGQVFGKVADYVQGRSERRRNKIEDLQRKIIDELHKPETSRSVANLELWAKQLRDEQNHSKNSD